MGLDSIGISPTLETMQNIKQLQQQGKDVLQLGFGQSPFPIPEDLCDQCRKHCHHGEYLPVQGLPELRKSIANFYQVRDGVNLSEHNVIIGPGSKELLFLLQFATSSYHLYLPTPSWVSYPTQSKIIGRTPHLIHTTYQDRWQLTPNNCSSLQVSTDNPKMLIINYPNNPSGLTYTKSQLIKLSTLFRKQNVTIIQDEIYHHLTYNDTSTSLLNLLPHQTIISSGISKSCGAGGWRLGYLIIPDKLLDIRDKIISLASETYSCAPVPAQYAGRYLFKNLPKFKLHWNNCNFILKTLGNYCADQFNQHHIKCHSPEGAYYILLDFSNKREQLKTKSITTGQQLVNALLSEINIAMLSGTAFSQLSETLTTRFCYVDFNGSDLLQNYDTINSLSREEWLHEYCPRVLQGVQRICEWFSKVSP